MTTQNFGGHTVKLVEHRGQWRLDLDEFNNETKIQLIRDLASCTTEWGNWRFTNHAVWVNKDSEELIAILKLLL